MVEVHRVLLYKLSGDGGYVAHSGLVDMVGNGATKKEALEEMKENVLMLREWVEEDPDLPYEMRPDCKVFDDFRESFSADPTAYQSRAGIIDKDTWLWIYDVDKTASPGEVGIKREPVKYPEVTAKIPLEEEPGKLFKTIMQGANEAIDAFGGGEPLEFDSLESPKIQYRIKGLTPRIKK